MGCSQFADSRGTVEGQDTGTGHQRCWHGKLWGDRASRLHCNAHRFEHLAHRDTGNLYVTSSLNAPEDGTMGCAETRASD